MEVERRYAIQGRKDSEADRVQHAIDHMHSNKAYLHAVERAHGDPDGRLLTQFVERFKAYRAGWRGNPRYAFEHKLHHDYYKTTGFPPMCVDIEAAALCDLACPFCYRQSIVTPDKIMADDLFYRIVDQCVELGVPSIKLNWRGEPLLHPNLPKFVDYAKRAGIVETIINTDAVTLTEEKSRALIDAGLDLLIYSFDGGSKETYEKMRVGRFAQNHFESVYENIRRFARLRTEAGATWPRTKIQMILTAETHGEQEAFFELFADYVDDVSVKAYTERGGAISALDANTRDRITVHLQSKGLPSDESSSWRDKDGNLFVAVGRLPCEQPFQRLMVAYDGTVCMCCYDWGHEYPIGYVDSRAYVAGPAEYAAVAEKVKSGAKGFELLSNVRMPKRYIDTPKRVQTLKEIWDGATVNGARQAHVDGRIDEVPICTTCPFKETYRWDQVPESQPSANSGPA